MTNAFKATMDIWDMLDNTLPPKPKVVEELTQEEQEFLEEKWREDALMDKYGDAEDWSEKMEGLEQDIMNSDMRGVE